MTLKEIAWRNLMRRKAKAGFILAGLMIGVSTAVAVLTFVAAMTHDINHKLEQYGANILVVPRSENLTLTYGGLSLGGISFEMQEIRESDLSRVRSIPNAANIAALGPVVLGVVEVGKNRVLMAGIDFETAAVLKPWWKIDGASPADNGVLLGSEAARLLHAGPDGRLTILGRDHTVSGVLEPTGSQDDNLIFARLHTAQSLLGKEGVISMAEVAALCKDCPIEDMVRQISEALPAARVMAIQQVVKGRMETIEQFRKFSLGISGVVVLIGSLVVLVTMMGSVRERTEEIGVFRAIGFRKSHVARLVLLEAGLVSGLAGILGYFGGWSAAGVAIRMFAESHHVSVPVDWMLASAAVLTALAAGLVSSIYPAMLAARMDPNDALRAL